MIQNFLIQIKYFEFFAIIILIKVVFDASYNFQK